MTKTNKQQLLNTLAQLLQAEEPTQKIPVDALTNELTKIRDSTIRALHLLKDGKVPHRAHRMRREKGTIYEQQLNNARAYILKNGPTTVTTLKTVFQWDEKIRVSVYNFLKQDKMFKSDIVNRNCVFTAVAQ